MKKLLVMVFCMVLSFVSVSHGAMWAGCYVGQNWTGSADVKTNWPENSATINNYGFRHSLITGLTLGYDFIPTGVGGYSWPLWMQYFYVAMDVSYNVMDASSQRRAVYANNGAVLTNFPDVNGSQTTLSFLLMGKLPLSASKEYLYGRIVPFVGIGPGIMFTYIDGNNFNVGSQTSTNVALVTEAGVRVMVTPVFSVDSVFRYRYANPGFDFNIPGGNAKASFDSNNFSTFVRLSYHF